MGVGPALRTLLPHSPLAFPSGGWTTFPMLGTVPHIPARNFSTVKIEKADIKKSGYDFSHTVFKNGKQKMSKLCNEI